MPKKKAFSLFEVAGIELEYMVVDMDTLRVSPTVDELFQDAAGRIMNAVPRGEVEWSSKPVAHKVELRTAAPTKNIAGFENRFRAEVRAVNALLAERGRMLLPGAAHPFMDPRKESVPWKHGRNGTHALHDALFAQGGHGWSNLQSAHLNLPFANDDEFAKLHTAIRMVLPIIPALSASSPILDGKPTGMLDARMHHYLAQQKRLPAVVGSLIPEAVFNQEDYYRVIFEPIARALQPFDKEQVMEYHLANSRGAVARFDRGAIEIRVVDVQECPSADLAIAEMIIITLRAMVAGKWVSNYLQRAWHEVDLLAIFKEVIVEGGDTVITNKDFLLMFGLVRESAKAQEIWRHVYQQVRGDLSEGARVRIGHILDHGCLARRILRRTGDAPSRERITEVYRELAVCLQEDKQFV